MQVATFPTPQGQTYAGGDEADHVVLPWEVAALNTTVAVAVAMAIAVAVTNGWRRDESRPRGLMDKASAS